MTLLIKTDNVGGRWALIDDITGKGVAIGTILLDFRGERWKLNDGEPPHRQGTTGYVFVTDEDDDTRVGSRQFYPSVFDCHWQRS